MAAPAKLPPGPRYPALIQGVGFWTRPLAFLEGCRKRYGPRFTIRLPGSPPFVLVSRPEEIKGVFTAPADVLAPGRGARVLQPIVGSNSVILLDGDAHMRQRRLMLPAFHGARMERLSDLVEAVTEREVAGWPADRPIALHPRLQRLTLEIILQAVFGLEPGPRLDALRDRLAAMLAFGDKPISLIPPPPNGPHPLLLKVGPFASFWRQRQEADELIFAEIEDRRREQRDDPQTHADRDDVLAMLLDARHEDASPMSAEELRDELLTLLVAGHETTASALAWAFQCLAVDPRALVRVRAELEDPDRPEDGYLLATIYETLRHRPVLPNAAPRLVVAPLELEGVMYTPGACLVPNAYLLHHDPDLYPDPYVFRPERWLDDDGNVRKPGTYEWIPFGGGRRRCLGASFALLEIKIVLRAVLSARELQPVANRPELPRRRNITIRPARGGTAWLRPRRDLRPLVAEPAHGAA